MRKMFSKKQIEELAKYICEDLITEQGLKKVQANPTLAGTESALESILIGSTKYKVGRLEDIKDNKLRSEWNVKIDVIYIMVMWGWIWFDYFIISRCFN